MTPKTGRIRPRIVTDRRIGAIVREARLRKALSQAKFARQCGISRRHLGGIERGSNCTVGVLLAILEQFPDARLDLAQLLASAPRTAPAQQ